MLEKVFYFAQVGTVGTALAIDEQGEATALVIALAVFVPDDGKYMATVVDTVETEIVPSVIGQQGVHHDTSIILWTKSHDARLCHSQRLW